MEKIPFEDGVKIKNATVTIQGQEYEVTPAQYSGKTPFSSLNLNKMQDNIDNAKAEKTVVNAIESRVATLEESSTQSTVLYESSSGNTGIIELSDSVSNYSCIEIVYKNNDDLYSSQRFIDSNFKTIVLLSVNPINNSGNCYIKSTNILVSDDVLRPVKYSEVSLYTAGNLKISSTDNRLSIVKVIGWK